MRSVECEKQPPPFFDQIQINTDLSDIFSINLH